MTRSHWRTSTWIVSGAVVVVLGLFWDTELSMGATWYRVGTFTHGFLVLPISLWLGWRCRHRVARLWPTPQYWGLPLLGVLGFAWLLGHLADVLVVQQLALVAMLQGLIWTALGTSITRALLGPLAFLVFAVPLGESLIPPLQDFTAFFTVAALRLSGLPVFWEGRMIVIPSGTWEVVEACSGVRYVIPSVAIGYVFAVVHYRHWVRRVVFLLASAVVPILANGVRAYGIVMLAHLSDNRIAIGIDHLIYGWTFFGVVMLLLFQVGFWWREPADDATPSPSSEPCSWPVCERSSGRAGALRTVALAATCGVTLLALAPLAAYVLSNRMAAPHVVSPAAPSVMLPWQPLGQYMGNWKPHFVGANAEVMQSYRAGTQQVDVYMAYYASQRQGAELISSENVLADRQQWRYLAQGYTRATVDGRALSVHELTMQSLYRTRLVWSWYWVAGDFTASPYWAKFLQVKARLLGGSKGAAVLAMSTDYEDDRAAAVRVLQDFLRHCSSLQVTLHSFAR